MKSKILQGLVCLLSLATVLPAAQLFKPQEAVRPGDTLEIVFDHPMVDAQSVGKSADTPWLQITPPVSTTANWSSQKSLQLTIKDLPKLSTNYQVQVTSGAKDTQGKEVSAEVLGDFASTHFELKDNQRLYIYQNGVLEQRKPQYLLQFNDEVDLKALEESLVLSAEQSVSPIAIKARYAAKEDLKKFYEPALVALWNQAPNSPRPSLDQGQTLKNIVIIDAQDLLPEGESWQLMLQKPLSNLAGTGTMERSEFPHLYWGTISPFKMEDLLVESKFDEPHRVTVEFTKPLLLGNEATEEQIQKIRDHLILVPEVPDLKIELNYDKLILIGSFQFNTNYQVEIKEGLMPLDQLPLRNTFAQSFTLEPDPAYISTEATESRGLAKSPSGFDFFAGNFDTLKLRVKRLNTEQYLQAKRLQDENYFAHLNTSEEKRDSLEPYATFESYPGEVVFEKEYKNTKDLQQSTMERVPWKEFLGGVEQGLVFFEMEATPLPDAAPGLRSTRGIINVTDLNVMFKKAGEQLLVYATSMNQASAIADGKLRILDESGKEVLSANTNAEGIADLKLPNEASWLELQKEDDLLLLPIDSSSSISFYSSSIEQSYENPWKKRVRAFAFTDRPIYKPGETVFFKAYLRDLVGDELSLVNEASAYKLEAILNAPNGREIQIKPIQLDPQSNFDTQFQLPEEVVGHFSINIRVTQPGDSEDEENVDTIVYTAVRVEEYKPNTFEIKISESLGSVQDQHYTIPVEANYLMGKPLSTAKLNWIWALSVERTIPEEGVDYHFGQAPKWSRYTPNGSDYEETQEEESRYWSQSGEVLLSDDGKIALKLPIPPPDKESLPQSLSLITEVTDINQQTISKNQKYTLPGAEFLLGAKIDSWYAQAGKEAQLSLIALQNNGKHFTQSVQVSYTVERQDWNIVKVQGAGNSILTKNQSRLELEAEGSTSLQNGIGQIAFAPKRGGTYFLTVNATDSNGKKLLTRLPFYSLGGERFPWAWDQEGQLTLHAQPAELEVGEETSIMVQAPYAAKALVTVERNRIHRYFIQDISPENPVIKIKAEEEDFPNAYVSVYLLRGTAASPHAEPMPDYRLGYVALNVNSDHLNLNVAVKPSLEVLKPQESVTIETTVTDSKNQAVPGANVTLFAVDEGVLSLVNFITPRADTEFHALVPLSVVNYFALYNVLNEEAKKRYRGNKGVIIGGGGEDEELLNDTLRKNFIATAYWNAKLNTDASGKVSASFEVPDSLTRYRVMALVSEGSKRFGTGESSFIVRKPLIIEPVVPRFANAGDTLNLKALLHHQAEEAGDFKVEVELDEHSTFVGGTEGNAKHFEQTIALKPGDSKALPFQVKFTQRGEAVWKWKVTSLSEASLSDSVESRFEITHPAPALREVHYTELNSSQKSLQLSKLVSPQLLEGDGQLQFTISPSRMIELESSLDFLLQYPYGCAEQTTSRLIPWLNLAKRYEALFPHQLDQSKAKLAIERGAQRLLNMQNYDGGIQYWPGSGTPDLWISAYAGFALFKAKDWGISIPEASLNSLTEYLAKAIREKEMATTTDSHKLTSAAMALYTLARVGKPEESFQNTLYQRRAALSSEARAFLALSMCLTNAKSAQILELIDGKPAKKTSTEPFWLGPKSVDGLKLIIYAHLGQKKKAEELMTQLLKQRGPQGHWGSTFSNAWILTGFATNNPPVKDFKTVNLQISNGGSSQKVEFQNDLKKHVETLKFTPNSTLSPIQLQLSQGDMAKVKVDIRSYPRPESVNPVQKGYSIHRTYKRMTPSGAIEDVDSFEIGDLVIVDLEISADKFGRYLAIEDPLPSVFEPVNPEISSQNQAKVNAVEMNEWLCDHREMRHDRVLFFTTYGPSVGKYNLRYLARVMAEGEVVAPPSKIEEMYDPTRYGLGSITPVKALPTKFKK